MPKLRKLHGDKLKLAAKVLFELPPSVTLPVFKRLSIDNVRTLLDQIKEEAPERRGLPTNDSSLLKPHVAKTTQASDASEHHIDDCPDSNQPAKQTCCSLAGMKRFATLTDDQIKAILKHCDTSLWAPALKNTPVAIQQKIMNCMAPAAAELLKVEIDEIGDVNRQEEEQAREGVIDTAFRLATNGHILHQKRSHESEAA